MHRRTVAAALAVTMLAYWLVAGQPLFAVAVASLVLSGERASAAGFTLAGEFTPALAGAGAVVAVGTLGYGVLTGATASALVVAGLVLLTAWLSGPPDLSWRPFDPRRDPAADPVPPEE